MTVDYTVSSLPSLSFGSPAPMSWEKFCERAGDDVIPSGWTDLSTQLRNAQAEARGGDGSGHPTIGFSLYWKNRILACFQEKDVLKREELLDKVWWDAAGELTDITAPLGKGALATYAVRLKIALKWSKVSVEAGNAVFDRLTAETKRD